LKSSPSTLLVLCDDASAGGRRLAETLADSLGLRKYDIVAEAQADAGRFMGQDVILVGYPRTAEWLRTMPASLHLQKEGFSLAGVQGPEAGDMFFGVFANPYDSGRVLSVWLPMGSPDAPSVAAKIPHYGRFSYLIFRDGQNRGKGSWETADSPVSYRWK
jgi:hypothetical protein